MIRDMSISKNKKISKNPEARYLVAEALTKIICKISLIGFTVTSPQFRRAQYILNELADAGISGITWSQKEGVFKSDKSKQHK